MKLFKDYPTKELKLIYNLLYTQLPRQSDLLDSELLHDLQRYLLNQAMNEGIDISVHAEWAGWLQNG